VFNIAKMESENSTTPTPKRRIDDILSPTSGPSPEHKKLITDIMEASLGAKLDLVLSRLDDIGADVARNTIAITDLSLGPDQLHECEKDGDVYEIIIGLNRRLDRAEHRMDELERENLDLKFRSMQQNMLVFNIAEGERENSIEIAYAFLKNSMRVPTAKFASKEIEIDVAHRIGRGKKRPLVIRFATRRGKISTMSHCGNLKGTAFYVRDQLPSEYNDRIAAQSEKFKLLKADKKNRVSFVRDSLILNGDRQTPDFAKNPLRSAVDDITETKDNNITRSEMKLIDNCEVRALGIITEDIVQIKGALARMRADPMSMINARLAYAYRYKEDDITTRGYDDDKIYGVSRKLLDLLEATDTCGLIAISKTPGRMKSRDTSLVSLAEDTIKLMAQVQNYEDIADDA